MTANICLIYTGGTMGSVRSHAGTLGPAPLEQFKERVLNLAGAGGWGATLAVESVGGDPIDSADANPQGWQRVREALRGQWRSFDGFVVIHGTDTLPYLAAYLSYAIEFQDKPIVVTGSMTPIFDAPGDAEENLEASVRVASIPPGPGGPTAQVLICFGCKILRGNRATKLGLSDFGISTPRVGELGSFERRGDAVVVCWNQAALTAYSPQPHPVAFKRVEHSNVALIRLFPGISAPMIRRFTEGLNGLVVEAYGSGTGPRDVREELTVLARQGLVVVVTTEVLYGDVCAGMYDTDFVRGTDDAILSGRTMLAEAALAKLYYFLGIARRQLVNGTYVIAEDGIDFVRSMVTRSVRGDW